MTATELGPVVRRGPEDRTWPGNVAYRAAMAARGQARTERWPVVRDGGAEALFHIQVKLSADGDEARALGLYLELAGRTEWPLVVVISEDMVRGACRQALSQV